MSPREIVYKDLGEERTLFVKPFSVEHEAQWEQFVHNADNGTIFHSRKFLNYHPPGRFIDASLIIEKDGNWRALLPAADVQRGGRRVLISHAGASMGGLVISVPQSIKETFRIVYALISFARDNRYDEIVMTLPPQIYLARPNDYLDFALLQSGFSYVKRELSSMIPLDFADEEALLNFSPSARRAVRRASSQGVRVRETDDYERFYRILEKNLKLRHNVRPTHSLAELLHLSAIFPEQVRLFAAYKDDRMIAGVVLFLCNRSVALAFYISHDQTMQQYRGVNLLFAEVIRWCIRRNFKYLDFGIFTVNMVPNWGLARFKESFGALGILRDTVARSL